MKIWRHAAAADDGPAQLAALADGSLTPRRREALEAEVARSPELAALLAEQERSLALVRGASAAVAAPAALRARIDAERRVPRRLSLPRLALGAGVAGAAAALALLFLLPGGGAPGLASAAELSARGATGPAPALQPGRPKLLARSVGGVPFPSWSRRFGWKATGVRADRLAGHRATTVFYEKRGRRLGYTIVDGAPLVVPRGAMLVRRQGTELHSFVADGRLVVTWLRDGRTCVLSGPAVERRVLLELAAWKV